MTAKVAAELSFDTKKAEAAMKRFGDFAESSLTEINSGLEIANKAWGAITGAIGAGIQMMSGWVSASMDAEKTQRLLARSLGANYDQIAELNDALSKKLGIDDDDLAAMQQKLIAQGVQTKSLEDATKATLGYAAATGKDLDDAAKKVAKAFTSSAKEAERLTKLYALAETQADTFEGRMRALDTAAGGFIETLGFMITDSENARKILDNLRKVIDKITESIGSETGRKAVDQFFVTLQEGIVAASSAALVAAKAFGIFTKSLGFVEFASHKVFGTEEKFFTRLSFDLDNLMPELEKARKMIAELDLSASESGPGWKRGQGDWSRGAGLDTEKEDKGKPKKTKAAKAAPDLAGGIAAPFDAPWARGMFSEVDQAREEEAIAAREKMLDEQDARRLARLNAEIEEHDFYAKLRSEQRERELAREREFYSQLGSIGQSGIEGFISGTITEWASGEASLAEAAGRAFFGMLSQIGSGLVALGSSAVAAGILGTVAPIFKPATGGSVGVAAGLGLIAAGGTLMALGGVGSRAMGGGPRSAPATSTSGSGFSSSEPRGFVGTSSQAAPQTTVINVNLGRGYVTGTPREVGRELRDLIRQAGSLEPGWAR